MEYSGPTWSWQGRHGVQQPQKNLKGIAGILICSFLLCGCSADHRAPMTAEANLLALAVAYSGRTRNPVALFSSSLQLVSLAKLLHKQTRRDTVGAISEPFWSLCASDHDEQARLWLRADKPARCSLLRAARSSER